MNSGFSEMNLVSIVSNRTIKKPSQADKVILFKPPYFTPWTPPLGIGILKSFLEPHGYRVRCFDFNTDPELWGMHHKYFGTIQTLEEVSINDGYSKLWWILNAHMLAYANGASAAECARVLETVIPMYGIPKDQRVIKALLPLVERFYRRLEAEVDSLDLADYSVAGTSTYSTSLGPSLFILKKLKQKYPQLKAVIGGGIFADDLALGSDNLETLLQEYSYIDHVILGEGELLFLKLLQGELAHKRVISIADLKGTTLQMKDVPVPDFSDLQLDNYYHLTIEGARSCPFQCSFCSETIQWGDYRKKPMDQFAAQVMTLVDKHRINSFFMGDSLMNPYIGPFSNELLTRKANVLYDGYLRADKPVTHRDRTKTWAQSGLYRVRLGIESASARVLDSMDKMTTPKTIAEALKSLATAGIRTTTYWIVGFPGETEDDFQETLEFIRENHRNIYELEAHPYYYYPYGQIGSRLYQCRSLYPDQVTDIIKFRVWDIIDCQPSREERYERLRRVSDLASRLGLPNIYTMSDRYQAEDRWLMLHPLSTEIYAGSRIQAEVPLPDQPVAIYANDFASVGANGKPDRDAVLSHRISVNKRLDERILTAALAELFQTHEMLRMSLQDGQFFPATVEPQAAAALSVSESDEDDAAVEPKIVESLLSEIKPAAGSSLRIALINKSASSRILLLAHRAIADSRSVVMLCEDLFRLYEQLANGKKISLPPIGRTYSSFMSAFQSRGDYTATDYSAAPSANGHSKARNSDTALIQAEDAATTSTTIVLDRKLTKEIFSPAITDYGVTPAAAILSAFLKCLAKAGRDYGLKLDLKVDHRLVDTGLERTLGGLTSTYRLPQQITGQADDLRQIQQTIRELVLEQSSNAPFPAEVEVKDRDCVLVNLEYFISQPWLEDDEWHSDGFVFNEPTLRAPYVLTLAPVLGDELKVMAQFRGETGAMLIEPVAAHLAQELEAIVQHCRASAAAEEFWQSELNKHDGQPNLALETLAPELTADAYSSFALAISEAQTKTLKTECQAMSAAIILAAYAILLSRLNGREDVMIVSSVAQSDGPVVAPLRLRLADELSFAELVRLAEQKTAQTITHASPALEILKRQPLSGLHGKASPLFDVGFIFSEKANPNAAQALEQWLKDYQGAERKLVLTLETESADPEFTLRLNCLTNLFGPNTAEKLAAYLQTIFEQAAGNVNITLKEITLDQHDEELQAVGTLSSATFNFN